MTIESSSVERDAGSASSLEKEKAQRRVITAIIIFAVVAVIFVIGAVILLAQPFIDTARVRDIFIICMASESLLVMLTLVLLVIQLTRLTNLIQNEIKPILESTNETISYVRGTTTFLSDNMVGPVIKLNEYIAGLSQLLQIAGLFKKKPKP